MMTRKTLIFGNGLGMALDSDFFSLDKAIDRTWGGKVLDQTQKDLVCRCSPNGGKQPPRGEDDMDTLQVALSACDLLDSLDDDRVSWLTKDGKKFPHAVRKFLYEVANSFHGFEKELPQPFGNTLAEFLRTTKSHVATLNYDSLIYQPLIKCKVLDGYDGDLCDGFHKAGFDPENMERKHGNDFGYYLHLHGSPLFVDREGATVKLALGESVCPNDRVSSHIVLTHVKHKRAVIRASQLLNTYWQYLTRAFKESSEIVLVGYSGKDEHLNELLKNRARDISVRVVEWDDGGDEATRHDFWCKILTRHDVTLIRLDSILKFEAWNTVPG